MVPASEALPLVHLTVRPAPAAPRAAAKRFIAEKSHLGIWSNRGRLEGGPSRRRPRRVAKEESAVNRRWVYERWVDALMVTCRFLELVPEGRDQDGQPCPGARMRCHDGHGAQP